MIFTLLITLTVTLASGVKVTQIGELHFPTRETCATFAASLQQHAAPDLSVKTSCLFSA